MVIAEPAKIVKCCILAPFFFIQPFLDITSQFDAGALMRRDSHGEAESIFQRGARKRLLIFKNGIHKTFQD